MATLTSDLQSLVARAARVRARCVAWLCGAVRAAADRSDAQLLMIGITGYVFLLGQIEPIPEPA